MFLRLAKKKLAGFRGIAMAAIRRINVIADISSNVGFRVVLNSQVTITDPCPVQKANIKIVSRNPLLLRLLIESFYQS